jgi:hypothetical protein
MKNFFLCFFLLPLLSSAQDTCHLKRETDPFTHQTKVSTGFATFKTNVGEVYVSVEATPTDIDLIIWLHSDPKCFDDQSTVQVNYDGDRLKANFRNVGSMNCDGTLRINFRNVVTTPSNLDRLTSRKIKSLRLTGNNAVVTEIILTEEQKQQFMRMASCVVRESKTLIKS